MARDQVPLRTSHVLFVVEKVKIEHFFLLVLWVSLVSKIPTTLRTYIYLNTSTVRQSSGRGLGTLKRNTLFQISRSIV